MRPNKICRTVLEIWRDQVQGKPKRVFPTGKPIIRPEFEIPTAAAVAWVEGTKGFSSVRKLLLIWDVADDLSESEYWAICEFIGELEQNLENQIAGYLVDDPVIGSTAMVTVKEASERTGYSVRGIQSRCERGLIPNAEKRRGRWLVTWDWVMNCDQPRKRKKLKKSA